MNELMNTNIKYEFMEKVIAEGDLSKLSSRERLNYYHDICKTLNLNPLTQPFKYIRLNGKLCLYATKDATEQLRKNRGISIYNMKSEISEGVYIVTVNARDCDGREDIASGAVTIEGLKGEMRANAILKSETKAKRRVTLSICGLGFMDETEIETIPSVKHVDVCVKTGEIITESKDEELTQDFNLELETSIDMIMSSITEDELKTSFFAAIKQHARNKDHLQKINLAKDKRKNELFEAILNETV